MRNGLRFLCGLRERILICFLKCKTHLLDHVDFSVTIFKRNYFKFLGLYLFEAFWYLRDFEHFSGISALIFILVEVRVFFSKISCIGYVRDLYVLFRDIAYIRLALL